MGDVTEIKAFIQRCSYPAWLVTRDGECIHANPALIRLTGIDTNHFPQTDWRGFLLEEERIAATASWQRSLATGTPFCSRIRFRGLDDVSATVELIAFGYKVDDATGVWLFTAFHTNGSTPQDPSLEAQLQATLNMIPAHTWYARQSGALSFVSERTAEYLGLPKDHPLRFGIDTGAEWDSHIPLLHPDDHDETRRVWSTCLRTGCAGEASFRVRNADGGYRWFLSRAEPLRASDGTLAFWIGVNLDNDVAKCAERELRDVIDTIPAVVWSALPDGSNTYVNSRFVEYSGMSAEQTAGSGWEQATHPDDLQQHLGRWGASVLSGEPHESEVRFRRSDGQYRWHLDRGLPLRDEDGRILKWYGVLTDIEDRKRVEEALRRSEGYLMEAQRLSHTGSWAFDATGFQYWSSELFRIHGLDPRSNAPTMDEYLQLIIPDDRQFMEQAIQAMLSDHRAFDFTKRIVRPDGNMRYVRCVGNPVNQGGAFGGFVGSAVDVTEQERLTQELRRHETYLAENNEALRRTEAYLAEAQTLSHMGSWAWRVAGRNAVHLSEEWYRIYGFDPKQGIPGWEERLRRVHPEDRDKWKGLIERAIRETSDYEIEFRILLPDGTVKWVHTVGHPVLSESGELAQFVGSSMDVTVRKRAEEKLKEQEAELRQMLDLTPQYLGVLAADGSPVYANRASLDYLGMSLDEWRRRSGIGDEVHPDDLERLIAQKDRASSTGSAFELELRVRKGDGSFRWFVSHFNPVHDEMGNVTRWYIASTDIHDRKSAEERLQQENAVLREEIDATSMFEEIVGASPALRPVLSHISKVAPSDSTVLITGETGTGKELVARAIHRRSHRSSRAFVPVNCAAIPRDLIASELFGHEKGAFTGATQRRLGRFELADGGTVFLDEVGELSPDTQAALLRVLQEREFERIGGTQRVQVSVRVIAATNRNLEEAVANGTFRPDLFYRLNVFPIEVPPLRERKDDILMLVEYFVQRYASRAGKHLQSIDKKTLELLHSYEWPGNIRELQNVIERSVILSSGGVFSVDGSWLSKEPLMRAPRVQSPVAFKVEKEPASEREIIEAALVASRGRVSGQSGAAARLGIPPSTLDHRIKALKINKIKFKFR